MKKILSVVLVLMLCLTMAAIAEEAPASPVAPALIPLASQVKIVTDAGVNLYIDESPAAQAAALDELDRIQSEGKEAIFGNEIASKIDADTNGNLLGLLPMGLSGYEDSMGDVTATVSFPAAEALTAGQKADVVAGIPNGIENGATAYDWTVFEGMADGNGGIEVTLSGDVMSKIAVGGALFAFYA